MALTFDGFVDDKMTLDIRGPRGGLTAARASELGAKVLSGERDDYERVILSSWGFSVEAAEVFSSVISRLPRLRSAVIADIIAGRPEAEGLAVYRALGVALKERALEELDFSDNAVGTKGVDVCRDFLSSARPTLQRLFYCNCGISAEAARSIADVICDGTPTALRVLHFDNNMSGGGGACAVADIVKTSPLLIDFRFTSSRGAVEGGVALARAFQGTPLIEKINLHDNVFTAPSAVALGATLQSLKFLRHLDVGDTLTKDSGMASIAAGLAGATSVTHLDVSENELTSRGAKSLAVAISRLPSLKTLIAHGNEFGADGAVAIVHALRCAAAAGQNFKDVILNSCELGSKAAVAAVEAVARSSDLVVIDVGNNEITSAGIKQARAVLSKNGNGDKLRLDEGDEDSAESEDDEDDDVSKRLDVDISASQAFISALVADASAKEEAKAAAASEAALLGAVQSMTIGQS